MSDRVGPTMPIGQHERAEHSRVNMEGPIHSNKIFIKSKIGLYHPYIRCIKGGFSYLSENVHQIFMVQIYVGECYSLLHKL